MFVAFFHGLFLKLVGVFLSLTLIGQVQPLHKTSFSPENATEVLSQFVVISDVHTMATKLGSPNKKEEVWRHKIFARTLRDLANAQRPQDALILLGDNTEHGNKEEYTNFYALLSRYNHVKPTLVAMGNHDFMASNTSDDALELHKKYYRAYTGTKLDHTYVHKELNGYSFVILGGDTKSPGDGSTTFSQAELDWLDEILSAQGGKPVFVFNHQPLGHVFTAPNWGSVGPQSEKLRKILIKYNNVFFFSGHLHTSANKIKLQKEKGVTYINLPTLTKKEPFGVGYVVDLYRNELVLRARDFSNSTWTEISHRVKLKAS